MKSVNARTLAFWEEVEEEPHVKASTTSHSMPSSPLKVDSSPLKTIKGGTLDGSQSFDLDDLFESDCMRYNYDAASTPKKKPTSTTKRRKSRQTC